jgi:hypothetical protein
MAGFVLIIQHQISTVEPEPYPTRIVTIARIGDEFEPQYVAIKRNGRSHIENLYQRRHPSDVYRHIEEGSLFRLSEFFCGGSGRDRRNHRQCKGAFKRATAPTLQV